MGELIRRMDWSKAPLGPMDQWPTTLICNLATILQSPVPQFICWGRELTILYNDAYIDLLGKKHVALGRRLYDVWPEARETIEPLIDSVFSGNPVLVENAPFTLMRRGFPEPATFDFSFSPLYDAHGSVAGLLNTTFEVTERKRSEEALYRNKEELEELVRKRSVELARSEHLYRFIAANLPYAASFIVDEDLRYLLAEGPALRDAGMKPADLEGKTIHEALPRELAGVYEPQYRRALAGEPVTTERTVRGRHFITHIVPISEDGGLIYAALAVSHDITDRKRAEEALGESEQRFRTMADGLPLIIWVHDTEGKQQFVNRTFYEFFGLTPEEMTPEKWTSLTDPETGTPYAEEFLACVREQRPFHGEVRVQRADGKWRWIESWGRPQYSISGEYSAFVGTSADITERKQVEEALRKSEFFYRQTLESIPGMVFTTRPDGYCDYQSQQWVEYTGVPMSEHLGDGWNELLHPDDRPRAYAVWKEAVEGRMTYDVEYRVRRHDGAYEWFKVAGRPIRDENGLVVRWFGVALNIDDLKRTEQALLLSEQRFRTVFEGAEDAIYVHDLQGRFFDANRIGYERLGYTKDELMGMTPMDINPQGQRENVPRRIETILKNGSLFFETVHQRKDGSLLPVEINSSLVEYDDKPAVISIVRDISAQQQIKEELIRSERLYRSIAQHLPNGVVYVFDKDLRILVAEGQALTRIGYSKEQLEGRTVYDLDDETKRILEPRYKRVLSGESLFFETEYRGRVMSSHYVPIKDTHGGTVLGMVVSADITAQVEARRQLERSKDKLEQRVRERTAELEHANRAKDEFLANMSHEIRTPMAGVLGLTEILLHQDLPAKIQRDLEMIRSSAESVMTLISDLFDLSRIQQGKFEFHPDDFDLRSMVRDAVGPFEFLARSKDLDFIVSIDENAPSHIHCDKNRLAQVLKNLVSNAIKFTERGHVRIDVKAEEVDPASLKLLVSVSDSGVGIPRSKQKDIFEAFTQLDPSYSKKFAGMGLGLAISKSLVEGMGGEIKVDSVKDRGTTFGFYVTCGIVTGKQDLTAPGIALSDLPPMTILLVEDNAVNRLFLRRALVTAGHKVGEAEDGKHALAKLGEAPFDLVLMDVQMPEMDGVEATRRIRSGKHGRADIPIIALTAYAMKGDREKFLENGMDGYVTKPVDFGELARVIAEVCGAGRPING
jgi:PAS domain S-box-containing protein